MGVCLILKPNMTVNTEHNLKCPTVRNYPERVLMASINLKIPHEELKGLIRAAEKTAAVLVTKWAYFDCCLERAVKAKGRH